MKVYVVTKVDIECKLEFIQVYPAHEKFKAVEKYMEFVYAFFEKHQQPIEFINLPFNSVRRYYFNAWLDAKEFPCDGLAELTETDINLLEHVSAEESFANMQDPEFKP